MYPVRYISFYRFERKIILLYNKLVSYKNSDYYPFHMPGHKRRNLEFANPYGIDITEIDGFDNLHHATEVIKESQDMAAELYGAKESFYLINGSTCGLLAAISAVTKKGDDILVARNCHKAVYHGIFLKELKATYVFPEITRSGIQGLISPEKIDKALNNNPKIKTVVITSPTYDGVVSDVKTIAEVVHKHGGILIVDEAHGAHFGFSKGFPENAVKQGADIVIVSVHKTLAAFTQTALLHVCSDRISIPQIKKYLGIYETSSPSYILMSGIERSLLMIKEQGEKLFDNYEKQLDLFYNEARKLKNIEVATGEKFTKKEAFDFDYGKILIFTGETSLSGQELHDILLEEYHLQMEMCSGNYVTAITSFMDTKEGFERLLKALQEIDAKYKGDKRKENQSNFVKKVYIPNEKQLEIYDAEEKEKDTVELETAIGKVSGDYVFLYPPGIPIIVPGEVISNCFSFGIYTFLTKLL